MVLGNQFLAKGYLVKPLSVTTYMKGKEQKLLGRFTLAVAGATKDSVDYIPFTVFGENTINFMQKYCIQGTQLLVQSSIHNSSYTKKVGKGKDSREEKIYSLEVIAHQVELLSQPKYYYENLKGTEASETELQER